jgi:hypothetical protein
MPESIPRAAQPAGHLSANSSSVDRPDRSPLPRFSLVSHSLSRTAFPRQSSIPRASIFESNALTTFTFDPNT